MASSGAVAMRQITVKRASSTGVPRKVRTMELSMEDDGVTALAIGIQRVQQSNPH